jgi:small subunit ribosomal protein S16
MALKIRLQRYGSKGNPFYRVVVAEASAKRDGRFVEVLGFYNPIVKGNAEKVRINAERADYWLSKGAQPTDTTRYLLKLACPKV